MEWPPHSGKVQEYPEIDRVAWLDPPRARLKLNQVQHSFLDELEKIVDSEK